MSKLIQSFIKNQSDNQTELYIDKVIKAWNSKFYLAQWDQTFRLIVYKRLHREAAYKLNISKEQALDIIHRASLFSIRLSTFKSAINWKQRDAIADEIFRLQKQIKERQVEIDFLSREIIELTIAINTPQII